MSIRRLALLPLIGAGILAVIGNVNAQLPKIPKVPKSPLPGVNTPAPEQNQTHLYCMGITNEQIDQYIKARQVQGQALQSELAKANAKKAEADALDKKRDAENTKLATENVNYLMKKGECQDAFKEKDPRSKEQSRLEALAEEATNANDEARAQLLQKRASRIGEALEIDSDKACGGGGASKLFACRDKKMAADDRSQEVARLRKLEAEAGKKGDRAKELEYGQKADELEGQMVSMAQMACMAEDPSSVMMGAQAPREETAEEQAAHKAAQDAFSNARENADKAGQDAAKLASDEYNKLDHCIRGVLNDTPGTPIDAATKAVIQKRAGDLKPFIK
jgi:hypothetical protein